MRALTILPIVIVIALLSFSVRFVDLYSGIVALNAEANAAGEAKKEEPPMAHDDMAGEDTANNGDDMHAMEGNHEMDAMKNADADADFEKWRDSVDEDAGVTTLKADMYQDLVARRKSLDAREKDLQTREALLTAAEMELERKYQELSHLRSQIEVLLGKQSEEEKARIQSLVTVYEGMKAKEAAAIFDTLDLDILVLIMGQMSERKLSPILAKMNPERARTVTILLAEQKQLPDLP